MEEYSVTMIAYFVAFLAGITVIVWGFYAVDKTSVHKSEKLLWKIMFVFAPPLAFLLFKIMQVERR